MKNILLACSLFAVSFAFAQKVIPPPSSAEPKPTPASERLVGLKTKKDSEQRSVVSDLEFRNVGPSIMSGRVVDLDVNPSDPTIFYVAYATGGVWYTNNNGTTFTPVFDNMPEINIGDIAVDWDAKPQPVIWVGTGESNSSRSSYAGTGIYKSMDGGKSWQYKGLPESHHIGQILIDKNNPNTVFCAVIGHLFSFNRDRGLYKTIDGGETWKQVLFIDEATGVIDVQQDPNDSKILYAIGWHRERVLWNFVESGAKTGIYKSTDGGETFALISGSGSNFPQEGVGRIGLSIFPGNSNVLYTIVDNQFTIRDSTKASDDLTPGKLRVMTKEGFLALNDEKISEYLENYRFPEKYTAESVKEDVRSGKYLPVALADYVADANADLFNKPITGAEVWASTDAGKSWTKRSDKSINTLFYTYGYYFGKIWISPFDQNELYIAGVGLLASKDGGKSWNTVDGANQHGDHHAMWINPSRRGHMINGNDGGLNITWDGGKAWIKCNTPAVGQFYGINVDMEEPYNVYGGLQDNGVWFGPSDYTASTGWHGEGQYPWKFILGGDGMQVMVDTRDNSTVYTGYQFGHYYRLDKETGEQHYVRPKMELGDKPLRFSWQTPIWLSQHNQDILYMCAQRVFRSMDQGKTFTPISGDLTRGGRTGDVPYGCISTVNESNLKFGLIYTGSDDGLIHVTKDGGNTWTRISDKLPQHMRVSRVVASTHVEGRVYATLSGCQWDHFKPYVYVSEDYGTTWKQIFADLPAEAVNVVREDPVNENLLFAGTDNGLYMTLDRGKTSMRMMTGMPAAPVHDLVIQTREHDLVVGTHGRSIYIVPIGALEQMNDSILSADLYVLKVGTVLLQPEYEIVNDNFEMFKKATVPLAWYTRSAGVATIQFKTTDGLLLSEMKDSSKVGVNMRAMLLYIDSAQTEKYQSWLDQKDREEDPEKYIDGKTLPLTGTYIIEIFYADGRRMTRSVKIAAG
ncbi:MAG TPA: glycosyl hydrolase [Bacteroidia bacterium]|nr:glycosyl hydrolase [Bacteroidia bacterium]